MRSSLLRVAWVCLSCLSGVTLAEPAPAADCNRNGRDDAEEVAAGESPDCNRNGFPDECDLDPAGTGWVLAPEIAVPATPIFLAGADLEADGDVDLMLSRGSSPWDVSEVALFRNDGAGGFAADPPFKVEGRGNLELVDLDGDGSLDLVIPARTGGLAALFRTPGNDRTVIIDYDPEEDERFPYWVKAADVDADGDADLLASIYEEDEPFRLRLLRNEGDERFVEAASWDFDSLSQFIASDWDGDSALDLAAGTSDSIARRFHILANDGAGSFAPPAAVQLEIQSAYLASGDLEGDGDADLFAVGDGSQEVAVVRNEGPGRFAPARQFLGRDARGVHAADLDQNGTLDLLTVNWHEPCGMTGSLSFLLQAGGGRLAEIEALGIPPTLRSVVPADFDGDGRLDVAIAPLTGAIALVHGEPGQRSEDCDGDRAPDECRFAEDDCNWNRRLDACEIRDGAVLDCDADGLPDGCESDCNHNGVPDDCDLAADPDADTDLSGIPDECESPAPWPVNDCDGDGLPDAEEIAAGDLDCNQNGFPDGCEVERTWLPRRQSSTLGYSPSAVAADLDGDGLSDLALSRVGSCCPVEPADLVIYLKTGPDGGWREAGDYRLGVWPRLLPAADIDADGDLDVLVSQRDAFISCARERGGGLAILYNSGAAAFAPGPVVNRGSYIDAAGAGDLDGDGDGDLLLVALALGGRGRVHVASNLGPAGFAAAGELDVEEPVEVALSDLDRDGDLDAIVTATRSGGAGLAFILANDGRGAFHPRDTLEVGSLPRGIAAGDLDGDGFPELVLGRYEQGAPLIFVFRNDGRGAFPVQESLAPPVHPLQITLGDWDGDGDADLFMPGGETRPSRVSSNAAALFLNLGGGRLAQPRILISGFFLDVLPLQADGDPELELGFTFLEQAHLLDRDFGRADLAVDTRPVAVAAPDLDGDGLADVLAAGENPGENAGELTSFRGSGPAGFEPPMHFGLAGPARSMAAVDLDGDGDVDAAVAEPFQVEVLRNEDGSLAPASRTRIGSDPVVVTASDLDADGDLDLATANSLGDSSAGDNITVLLNDGDGSLGGARNYAAGVLVRAVVAADLDGDGDADLAAASEGSRSLSVFAGLGGGSFALGVEVPLPTAPSHLLAGDLDRDGDADLITLGDDEIYLLRSGGAAGFGQPLAVADPAEEKPYGLALLDADEDADLDLLLASRSALHLHRNQDGAFGAPAETFHWEVWEIGYGGSGDPPPPDRVSVAIADYDGNGTPDPVVALADARNILVFFTSWGAAKDGDGDRIPDDCLPAGDHPFRRGDANADGRFDISDPIRVLRHLFLAGEELPCDRAGDGDDNGRLEVSDAVRSLNHLFLAGPPLAPPFVACGEDSTPDALGCANHAPCGAAAGG